MKSEKSAESSWLNLGFTPDDDPDAVTANRRLYLDAVASSSRGPEGRPGLVTLKQMHSASVRCVGRSEASERALLWGDGLITSEANVLLGIQTADCLPVLIVDRRHRVAAALHAGWRGTVKAIAARGVAAAKLKFGSNPADLTAAIGPGIGSCCFDVGSEIRDLFAAKFSYANELFSAGPRLRLNLREANRRQLLDAGVPAESIFDLSDCTSCHTGRFFSYRAEKGRTGRMMAVIGMREKTGAL